MKLHSYKLAASLCGAAILILIILLYRVDTVCKQQVDTLDQIMELRQEIPAENAEQMVLETTDNKDFLVSLGEFRITHYCPCERCCGKTDGITYTGTVATAGRTIGVDPDVIPLGSTVVIDGHEYVAEDIGGGIKGNEIDMFVDSHEEALQLGVKYEDVKIYEREMDKRI